MSPTGDSTSQLIALTLFHVCPYYVFSWSKAVSVPHVSSLRFISPDRAHRHRADIIFILTLTIEAGQLGRFSWDAHSFQRHFWLPHIVPRMLSSLGVRHGALSFDDLTRPWEQLWGEWSVSVSV